MAIVSPQQVKTLIYLHQYSGFDHQIHDSVTRMFAQICVACLHNIASKSNNQLDVSH